jgi:hypothetical protein
MVGKGSEYGPCRILLLLHTSAGAKSPGAALAISSVPGGAVSVTRTSVPPSTTSRSISTVDAPASAGVRAAPSTPSGAAHQ